MNAIYLQRRFASKLVKIIGVVIIVVIIAGYAIWRSMNYAKGPEIMIIAPLDGASISASTTEITGKLVRAVNLSLNGRNITIDEQGNFKETLIVFKGINTITLEAYDQFKRGVRDTLVIYGM